MESLPLFPGLFEAPATPAPRRGRKERSRATASAAAVVEALAPDLLALGSRDGDAGERGAAPAPVAIAAEGSGRTPSATTDAAGSAPTVAVAAAAEVAVAVRAPAEAPVVAPARLVQAAVAPHPRRSERGVLVFDVETTGTDRKKDQVIELCLQRGLSGTDHTIWRFKPTVPISPGAQAVHGISMDDLEGCPPFAACADEITAMFAEAEVIVGYNLAFDVDMLQAEYERAGRPPLELAGKSVVDPFRLWQQCEPRSLQHAHQRFVGQGFEAAHSAAADVAATGRVLAGMLVAFGLDGEDWGGVAKVCDPQRPTWVGPSRHLQWDGPTVVLSFGKHAGVPLHQLATGEHAGYLRWVCDRDFPAHVAEVCARALDLAGEAEAFLGWVRERFGPPPAAGASAGASSTGASSPAVPAPAVSSPVGAQPGAARLLG